MLILALLAQLQAEPPKTVNDEVLGEAKDFTTAGPARVCIGPMAVTASTGATVQLLYSGIHNASLRLATGATFTDFHFGEIWARPPRLGRVVFQQGDFTVRRIYSEKTISYGIFTTGGPAKKPRLTVRVEGKGLSGGQADRALLSAVSLDGTSAKCDRTYQYGWPVVLGEVPVSEPR